MAQVEQVKTIARNEDFLKLQHRASMMMKLQESEGYETWKEIAAEVISDVVHQMLTANAHQHDEIKGAYHGMMKIINLPENIIIEEQRRRENARPWSK